MRWVYVGSGTVWQPLGKVKSMAHTGPHERSEPMYKVAFYGCAHLGYRMRGMSRRHPNGANLREADGYTAHELIMRDILANDVNGIVDGGDLFHVEHPPVLAVNHALHVDDLRVAAGDEESTIWRITNGGNHDNGASTRLSAVSQVHRSWLGSMAVFPSDNKPEDEQIGPWPGLYEVHQPDPDIPLYIHVVSHNGLDSNLANRGIIIDPQPVDNAVNLLASHGIFSADGRLFGADDRHGAHRVIPEDWANRGWDQVILSDYHTLGPIPGFGPDDGRERGQVWMTGSAVRRGYSDDVSPRGWLEVTLQDNGRVTVTPHYIWQRPQVDFPIIDARTMTSAEIDSLVRERLVAQDMWDANSEEVAGDGGFILRQVISHTTPQQRRALGPLRVEWARLAADAAYWSADYVKPLSMTIQDGADESAGGGITVEERRHLNLTQEFSARKNAGQVGQVLTQIGADDAALRERVIKRVTNTLAGIQTIN